MQSDDRKPMIIGVNKVTCTCLKEMKRTGGVFGAAWGDSDTYYCQDCEKYVVVITPNREAQNEFNMQFEGRS